MKKWFFIFIPLMPQKANFLYFKNAAELEADQENTKPKLLILEMVFPLKINLLQLRFLLTWKHLFKLFSLHCKLCHHYFETKLSLSSASTEERLLDCSLLERIPPNFVLSGSTSIALHETFLLLLREKKRKLAEKDPQMCYNHYTSRWLHLFNMLFLTFFCLLFLSHESCACGVSKRKAKQHFSQSHFFP